MATGNNNSSANFKSWPNATGRYDFSVFTYALWVKMVTQPTNSTFFSHSLGGIAGDIFIGTASGNGNQFRGVCRLSNNATNAAIDSTTRSTGVWYHVALTWDGTTITLYVNGASAATNTPGGGVTQPTTDHAPGVLIRDVDGAHTNPPDAQVADPCIYNVALTASEIASLAFGCPPNLVRPSALRLFDDCLDANSVDVVNGGATFTGTVVYGSGPPTAGYPRTITPIKPSSTGITVTAAPSLAALTLAAAGGPVITVTGASTLAALTLAASGDTVIAATAALAPSALTLAAAIDPVITVTAAPSMTAWTCAAAIDPKINVAAALAPAALTLAAASDPQDNVTAALAMSALTFSARDTLPTNVTSDDMLLTQG